MLSAIINWLFPPTCTLCQSVGAYLCRECLTKCERAKPTEEPWVTALFSYKDKTIKRAIWDIKYHGQFAAADAFGELLAEAATSFLYHPLREDVLIVPIPASHTGQKKRGYNQADMLARALADNADFPARLLPSSLVKVKRTERQATLHIRSVRLKNMGGAFAVNPKLAACLRGQTVLLVDDVTTTGATLRDARLALMEAEVKEVWAVCVGH